MTPLVSGCHGVGSEPEAPVVHVELQDPFMDNTVAVRLEAKNRVHVTLSESVLERIHKHNEVRVCRVCGLVWTESRGGCGRR